MLLVVDLTLRDAAGRSPDHCGMLLKFKCTIKREIDVLFEDNLENKYYLLSIETKLLTNKERLSEK